jgi:hypothetical protein
LDHLLEGSQQDVQWTPKHPCGKAHIERSQFATCVAQLLWKWSFQLSKSLWVFQLMPQTSQNREKPSSLGCVWILNL